MKNHAAYKHTPIPNSHRSVYTKNDTKSPIVSAIEAQLLIKKRIDNKIVVFFIVIYF